MPSTTTLDISLSYANITEQRKMRSNRKNLKDHSSRRFLKLPTRFTNTDYQFIDNVPAFQKR